MAIQTDITADDKWFAGDDRVLRFAIAATNIAGWTFAFELEDSDNVNIFTAVSDGGAITITDEASGVLEVAVGPTDVPVAKRGRHAYRLRRADTGFVTTLAYGAAEIL